MRVYVREKGGKRSFYPAPRIPDLRACYWLRYDKDLGQAWQRVGHYDLVVREKLLLRREVQHPFITIVPASASSGWSYFG